MNEADALDLFQAAIWTVLVSAGPAVAAAMIVGLVIALFQALLTNIPALVIGAPHRRQSLPDRPLPTSTKRHPRSEWHEFAAGRSVYHGMPLLWLCLRPE